MVGLDQGTGKISLTVRSYLDQEMGREDGKQARGFVLTRGWVEEAKNRYSTVSPDLQTSLTSLDRSGSGSKPFFANVHKSPETLCKSRQTPRGSMTGDVWDIRKPEKEGKE